MTDAFLNCNIWSVPLLEQPYLDENFYLVYDVYRYNSMESGIVTFKYDCVQIPEYEILDNHLLNNLDFNLINENAIPILRKITELRNEYWKIDLRYYEDYKLQHPNIY